MAGTRYRRGGQWAADMAVYARLMSEANTNDAEIESLRQRITMAMRQELTFKQRICVRLYYVEQMSMSEIAEQLGIDQSTVSRNIKRGEANLRRCLRFGAANLLNSVEVKTPYGVVERYSKREGFENVDHH